MDASDYREIIRTMRVSKRLGQNFLVNRKVAKTEANFGIGKRVLELGPGLGMLTGELCRLADSVVAIEKDRSLFEYLSANAKSGKLELINSDFFAAKPEKMKCDIMIANIPYNLSSRVVEWLGSVGMPAVLCLQKEFVEHMLSKPSTRNYSRLSVCIALQFGVTHIIDVPANDFYPEPRVGSALVYMKPKNVKIPKKELETISLLMMHKKKKLRNAIADSARSVHREKEELVHIAERLPEKDKRVFQMEPDEIFDVAKRISKQLSRS